MELTYSRTFHFYDGKQNTGGKNLVVPGEWSNKVFQDVWNNDVYFYPMEYTWSWRYMHINGCMAVSHTFLWLVTAVVSQSCRSLRELLAVVNLSCQAFLLSFLIESPVYSVSCLVSKIVDEAFERLNNATALGGQGRRWLACALLHGRQWPLPRHWLNQTADTVMAPVGLLKCAQQNSSGVTHLLGVGRYIYHGNLTSVCTSYT